MQSSASSIKKTNNSTTNPRIHVNNEISIDNDNDSPGTKMLKTFRKVDYDNAKIVALNDSKDYAPFKKEDELLKKF